MAENIVITLPSVDECLRSDDPVARLWDTVRDGFELWRQALDEATGDSHASREMLGAIDRAREGTGTAIRNIADAALAERRQRAQQTGIDPGPAIFELAAPLTAVTDLICAELAPRLDELTDKLNAADLPGVRIVRAEASRIM